MSNRELEAEVSLRSVVKNYLPPSLLEVVEVDEGEEENVSSGVKPYMFNSGPRPQLLLV